MCVQGPSRRWARKHWRRLLEDITARKQAEEALHIQHDLSQTLSACDDLHKALELILDATLHRENLDSGGIYAVCRASMRVLAWACRMAHAW
jgi:hypothetical protein